jgi:thimet oligopeptidase
MLNTKKLPVKTYTAADFAWVKWTPKDILAIPEKVLDKVKADHEVIKKIPKSERTFENTILALEKAGDPYGEELSCVGVLGYVAISKEVRDAAHMAEELYSKEIVDIAYDENLYLAIKEYVEGNAKKEKLEFDAKKLLGDTWRGYLRMGFGLPKAKRELVKKNIKERSKLSIQFDKNLNEYKDHIWVSEEETEGLSEIYLKGLQRDGKGRYKVTLEYPDSGPFLTNARNDKKRKELADKLGLKGGKKNLEILTKMMKLREVHAKLLGYKTHADYVLEEQMAKTPKAVYAFLQDLEKRVAPLWKKEFKQLQDFKRKLIGDPKAPYTYYDGYYSNELKKKLYNVDSQKIREYFPFEKVKKGLFEVYQTLLGVTFQKTDLPVWQYDVESYAVKDGGKIIAYFFMDLFPREGKFSHACAYNFFNGEIIKEGGRELYKAPASVIIANFARPQKNIPSLLTHGEVETLFHEFGHVMHGILTKTRFASQAGTNVVRDYVEMPSQILENWVWDKKMLKKISAHFQTGKSLPDALIEKMKKAKNFVGGYAVLRQLTFGLLDMDMHTGKVKGALNTHAAKITERLTHISPSPKSLHPAGFGHLAGGYDAGYYGYLWSEVFAQDMFTEFEKKGLLNKAIGKKYREWILEKGSSMDEMELVKGFLGRKPNNKAFLRSIGVGK